MTQLTTKQGNVFIRKQGWERWHLAKDTMTCEHNYITSLCHGTGINHARLLESRYCLTASDLCQHCAKNTEAYSEVSNPDDADMRLIGLIDWRDRHKNLQSAYDELRAITAGHTIENLKAIMASAPSANDNGKAKDI